MRKIVSVVVFLIANGCAHSIDLKKDPAGFDTRVLELKYDRQRLAFLFLVSPKSAAASIDDRVIEHLHLLIEDVQDCQTQNHLKYNVWDYVEADELEKHLVKLEPGFWYGAPVVFDLFDKPGPDCLEISAQYRPIADAVVPTQTVRFRVSVNTSTDSP